MPIKVLQVALDTATVVLIFLVGRSVMNCLVGLITAALWAVYPFAIYSTLYVGTETMFAFLLVGFLLLLLRGIERESWGYFAAAGAALALATLTRGATQFVPLVLPMLWFLWGGRLSQWFINCAVCALVFALVISPWSVRNYLVVGEVIPVGLAGGVFLWGAKDELLTIDERNQKLPLFLEEMRNKGIEGPSNESSPMAKDRYVMRIALEHYKEQIFREPIALGMFFIRKFLRLWYATESGHNHALVLIANLPLYFLAVAGLFLARRRERLISFLPLAIVGYFAALHTIAFPLFRYMLPVMPLLFLYTALALSSALGHKGGTTRAKMQDRIPIQEASGGRW